jgi:hypothetical protein
LWWCGGEERKRRKDGRKERAPVRSCAVGDDVKIPGEKELYFRLRSGIGALARVE